MRRIFEKVTVFAYKVLTIFLCVLNVCEFNKTNENHTYCC